MAWIRAVVAGVWLALGFVGVAWAEPPLWVVHGPNATVYLFGSVHTLKHGTVWRSAAVEQAFARADAAWFEMKLPGDATEVNAAVLRFGIDPRRRLTERLPPAAAAQLREAVAVLQLPGGMGMVDQMRPWLAAMTITAARLVTEGLGSQEGVDFALAGEAQAAGKPIQGLETVEQQAEAIAGVPEEDAMEMLQQELDGQDSQAEIETWTVLMERWLAGDEAGLERAMSAFVEIPAVYAALVDRRNAAWVPQIERLVAEGHQVVFITVGIGHLVGPGNLRALLERDGVRVERVAAEAH